MYKINTPNLETKITYLSDTTETCFRFIIKTSYTSRRVGFLVARIWITNSELHYAAGQSSFFEFNVIQPKY